MSNWQLIYLDFGQNAAHFGEVGIGIEETSERVRSDTLFSAIISTYARLYGGEAVKTLLEQFQKQQPPFPFLHSSTFIYRCSPDGQYTYYLPKPSKFPKGYPIGDDLDFSKTYKRLNYLPLVVWQRWYQKEGFTDSDKDQLTATTQKKEDGFKNKSLEQAGTFDYSSAFKKHQLPKVAIDRATRSTNFYHTGFVQFKSLSQDPDGQSGLYFLLYFPESNPELENELKAVLNLLGEEGIGGERSSGAGRFTAKWSDLPPEWEEIINFSASDASHSLLSLFWNEPNNSEIQTMIQAQDKEVSYNILERGGWIASSPSGIQKRRKKVRMFEEGSVFPFQPQGALADVTPTKDFKEKYHRVYRSGLALSLPIQYEVSAS